MGYRHLVPFGELPVRLYTTLDLRPDHKLIYIYIYIYIYTKILLGWFLENYGFVGKGRTRGGGGRSSLCGPVCYTSHSANVVSSSTRSRIYDGFGCYRVSRAKRNSSTDVFSSFLRTIRKANKIQHQHTEICLTNRLTQFGIV